VNTLLAKTVNDYEAKLLQERQKQAQMVLDHANDMKQQMLSNLNSTAALLKAKDDQLAVANGKIQDAQNSADRYKSQLNDSIAEQNRLKDQVNQKNNEINDKNNTVAKLNADLAAAKTVPPATIYQHCNYGGYSINLNAGRYTLRDLAVLGMANDDISSIKVPQGRKVHLYEHDNFKGKGWTQTSDNACFTYGGYNDIVSSIIVE
jgi:hypothetical protein